MNDRNKIFSLEFMYSNKDGEMNVYTVDYKKKEDKEKVLKETINKLAYEYGATNIVAKRNMYI